LIDLWAAGSSRLERGYAPANPPEWIDRLRPQVALLSVAADDRDGLPSPETLEAL